MSTKKTKYIPTKNYIIASALILGVILIFLYAFGWYNVKNKEKFIESYLISNNTNVQPIKSLQEIENLATENPINYFIFTGYTGDEYEYELEKDLKPLIDDYNISSSFYYFNVTGLKDDNNFLKEFSELIKTDVNTLPTIIYFEDGIYQNKIEGTEENPISAKDFETLLTIYGYEKSE